MTTLSIEVTDKEAANIREQARLANLTVSDCIRRRLGLCQLDKIVPFSEGNTDDSSPSIRKASE